jgi:hypothetical protein
VLLVITQPLLLLGASIQLCTSLFIPVLPRDAESQTTALLTATPTVLVYMLPVGWPGGDQLTAPQLACAHVAPDVQAWP